MPTLGLGLSSTWSPRLTLPIVCIGCGWICRIAIPKLKLTFLKLVHNQCLSVLVYNKWSYRVQTTCPSISAQHDSNGMTSRVTTTLVWSQLLKLQSQSILQIREPSLQTHTPLARWNSWHNAGALKELHSDKPSTRPWPSVLPEPPHAAGV
jgi:hypothetical protein